MNIPLRLPLNVSTGFLGYKSYPNKDYVKLRWDSEILAKIGMSDIEYPVPKQKLEQLVTSGHIRLSDMLFWIQSYSEDFPDDWLNCEPAMLSLSKLLVSEDMPEEITIEGDHWRIYIGSIDLTKEIITIQRGSHLLAALQKHGDGHLATSAYHPLDAKSVRLLRGLFSKPAPDGTVCMRPNNWEYARDQSASIGNAYAAERNDAYLSYWEFGLGISYNGSIVQEWHSQRDPKPIEGKYIAMQLQLEPSDPIESGSSTKSTKSNIYSKEKSRIANASGHTIRKKALEWAKTKFGKLSGPAYCSKYYEPDESFTGTDAWWIRVPIKSIARNTHVCFLLEKHPHSDNFYCLNVPTSYLKENGLGLAKLGNHINLFLSA